MRRGRPLKTHPQGGGATLPKKIFMRSMGLICFSAFRFRLALAGCPKTPTIQAITHIYMPFVWYWCVRQSVSALSCIMYARMCVLG